jgi:hypothetical protein
LNNFPTKASTSSARRRMTVDESQLSSPGTAASTAASSGTPKAKATIVKPSGSKSPRGQGQFQQPEPLAPAKPPYQMEGMSPNLNSFEAYAQANPAKAEKLMGKLTEVTGVIDRAVLYKALNQARKPDNDYDVNSAIEWILQMSDCTSVAAPATVPSSSETQQRTRRKTPGLGLQRQPVQSQFINPGTPSGHHPVNNHGGYTPTMQPPNSPSASAAAAGASANVLRSNSMPLVDLTDPSNDTNNKDEDSDLEKAIQLSLQDAKQGSTNFGVTQEEQDVSRALEASLLETNYGGKRSRGMIEYVDPLNPHDRKRNGMVSLL